VVIDKGPILDKIVVPTNLRDPILARRTPRVNAEQQYAVQIFASRHRGATRLATQMFASNSLTDKIVLISHCNMSGECTAKRNAGTELRARGTRRAHLDPHLL
jgi:hypothetical protein